MTIAESYSASLVVVRTPLLPFRAVFCGPTRTAQGRDLPLLETCRTSEIVREALWLAAPDFFEQLDAHQNWEGLSSRHRQTLYKYSARMASRATPFGLFAGITVGLPGERTRIALGPRSQYVRKTRLDSAHESKIVDSIVRTPGILDTLTFSPNNSAYVVGNLMKFASAHGHNPRAYHEVAVKTSDHLLFVLSEARQRLTLAELSTRLMEFDDEIQVDDATAYLHALVEDQLLFPDFGSVVSGTRGLSDLIGQLPISDHSNKWRAALHAADACLAELDAGGLGAPRERYQAIATALGTCMDVAESTLAYQVSMTKPSSDASLGSAPIREILTGVAILQAIQPRRDNALTEFRRSFVERYGEREVRLVEALDEDVGIGFSGSRTLPSAAGLLNGIHLSRKPDGEVWTARDAWLARRLQDGWSTGSTELSITEADLRNLSQADPLPLPDAFAALASIASASADAIDRGDFRVLLKSVAGPSGARLLARFCDVSPELTNWIEPYLRSEERTNPGAVYAEVIHLPEGKLGNVLQRPLLRRYEIPYLGSSTVERDFQIPVADIFVSVKDRRIQLRSERLGREVVPRLTAAHNYWHPRNVPIYRFLCMMQSQNVAGTLKWDWGLLAGSAYLPRVTHGRLVLARASWWVRREELAVIRTLPQEQWTAALSSWRESRSIPRFASIVEGDNELLLDLTDPESVEVLVEYRTARHGLRLMEMFPGPDDLWVSGPEGTFAHEVIVPFVRSPQVDQSHTLLIAHQRQVEQTRVPRTFPPGSDWVYAKLFCGPGAADELLCDTFSPLATELMFSGVIDGWFFIRFEENGWHLRLRFSGKADALKRALMPRLEAIFARELSSGRSWKVQLDTYERECERYGGTAGLLAAEQIFFADSEACCALLPHVLGDGRADLRWRVAIPSVDLLLTDLGLSDRRKATLARRMRDNLQRGFNVGKDVRESIARRVRQEAQGLRSLLSREESKSEFKEIDAILLARSRQLVAPARQLKKLSSDGSLSRSLEEIAASLVHVHLNRLLRSAHREHEVVLYQILYRLFMSRVHVVSS
ncbi:MAG TPA: lantibiotic dehydratase [Candidatus Polarisedimenticolaceae bacterium]|nr:lantibiotic dehydratase [Candidatus Polarisedimenticolaceae bacterium]